MDTDFARAAACGQYNSRVLVGNWSEDKSLKEVEAKRMKMKQALGTRLIDEIRRNTAAGSMPAKYSSQGSDGFVRFGDAVAFLHEETRRNIASNISTEVKSSYKATREFQASGVRPDSLRTTIMISRPPGAEKKVFVEFGDSVLLCTRPEMQVSNVSGLAQKPFFLMSTPLDVVGFSSASDEQEVRFAKLRSGSEAHANLLWQIEHVTAMPGPVDEDRRIRSSDRVQIVHKLTGRALALDESSLLFNDYGPEPDLFCCLDHTTKRVHIVKREAHGMRTGADRLTVQRKNIWRIETTEREEKTADSLGPLGITNDTVLAFVAQQFEISIKTNVLNELTKADRANEGVLDRVAFKFALLDAGLQVTEDEMEHLLDIFDQGDHTISLHDFAHQFRLTF